MSISFFVSARPAPGGSKIRGQTKSGRSYFRPASKYEAPWREEVAKAARIAMQGREPFAKGVPVRLTIVFQQLRPKFHFKSNGELKEKVPPYPTSAPDTTKLTRSTEDAMKHIVWHDDAAVVLQVCAKIYSKEQGAQIVVEEMKEFA